MNKSCYPGFFITFEGGEGAGKSTQARLLRSYLESRGYSVLLTREPGGPEIAEQIRRLLLDPVHKGRMDGRTELLLYAAARAQHVAEWIRPALEAGRVVISDRYADATFAYQGFGRQISLRWLAQLHEIATDNLVPDLTCLLDLPVEIGLGRVQTRGEVANRLEIEAEAFHQRVRDGYRHLAETSPDRVVLLDATQEVEEIQAEIRREVDRQIKL